MKKVSINRVQGAKLYNWLEANKALAERMELDPLTKAAIKDLGFPVPPSAVGQLRRDMGIVCQTRGGARASGKIPPFAKTLARELVDLRRKLSEPVSAELEEMAK